MSSALPGIDEKKAESLSVNHLNANVNNGKRNSGHLATDSEIISDLHNVFKNFDIADEGLLDQASFITALLELGVNLPYKDLEAIFSELDTDDTGFIEYETVLQFIKAGKIPSTLLNKIKTEDNNGNAKVGKKRNSILFGRNQPVGLKKYSNNTSNTSNNNGASLLPKVNENQELIEQMESKLNKSRKKLVDRAIIVIKKAALKNIKREEVVEFLMDKGMNGKEIELAYLKAHEKVFSKDEQLKALQDTNAAKTKQLNEQIEINARLSNEITQNTVELEMLRNIIAIATKDLTKLQTNNPYSNDADINAEAANELTNVIKKAKSDVETALQSQDNDAVKILKRDLENLQSLSSNILKKQYKIAYLAAFTLPTVIRNSIPLVAEFLSGYEPDDSTDEPIIDTNANKANNNDGSIKLNDVVNN